MQWSPRDQVAPPRNDELIMERYGDRETLGSIEGAGRLTVVNRTEV